MYGSPFLHGHAPDQFLIDDLDIDDLDFIKVYTIGVGGKYATVAAALVDAYAEVPTGSVIHLYFMPGDHDITGIGAFAIGWHYILEGIGNAQYLASNANLVRLNVGATTITAPSTVPGELAISAVTRQIVFRDVAVRGTTGGFRYDYGWVWLFERCMIDTVAFALRDDASDVAAVITNGQGLIFNECETTGTNTISVSQNTGAATATADSRYIFARSCSAFNFRYTLDDAARVYLDRTESTPTIGAGLSWFTTNNAACELRVGFGNVGDDGGSLTITTTGATAPLFAGTDAIAIASFGSSFWIAQTGAAAWTIGTAYAYAGAGVPPIWSALLTAPTDYATNNFTNARRYSEANGAWETWTGNNWMLATDALAETLSLDDEGGGFPFRAVHNSGAVAELNEYADGGAGPGDARLDRYFWGRYFIDGVIETTAGYYAAFNLIASSTEAEWRVESGNPTASVLNVGDGYAYATIALAYAAAVNGDLIQLFDDAGAGSYNNMGEVTLNKTLTIRQIDRTFVITGNSGLYSDTGGGITLEGLIFSGTTAGLFAAVRLNGSSAILRRCLFLNIGQTYGVNLFNGNSTLDGCVFDAAGTSVSIRGAGGGFTCTVRNGIVKDAPAVGIERISGTVNVYNTPVFATGAAFNGVIGGDYNASDDATAPGVNSFTGETFAGNFNADYTPLWDSDLNDAGDPLNKAATDYFGNTIGASVPIGAIIFGYVVVDGFLRVSDYADANYADLSPTSLELGDKTTPEVVIGTTNARFTYLGAGGVRPVYVDNDGDLTVSATGLPEGKIPIVDQGDAALNVVLATHEGRLIQATALSAARAWTFTSSWDGAANKGVHLRVADEIGLAGTYNITLTSADILSDLIDNAAAVNVGGGIVGIPVTGHAFVVGQYVALGGTTNYDGFYRVEAVSANQVNITAVYVAEAFAGAETIIRKYAFSGAETMLLDQDFKAYHLAFNGQNFMVI